MLHIVEKMIEHVLKDLFALGELGDEEFKKGLEDFKNKHPMTSEPPKKLLKTMDIKRGRAGGGVFFTAQDKVKKSNKKVLFIHGGGFFAEALSYHWDFCRRLTEETGCEIYFPQYPVVPESSAGDSHEMLLKVYERLLKTCAPEDITMIGDSAGGTLCLSLSMLARDRGLPMAKHIVLISPGFMIGETTEEEAKRLEYIQQHDHIIGKFPIDRISVLWRGELSSEDYRADATKGSLDKLPPITMFSGTHDIMNIPARRFARRLKEEKHTFCYMEKKQGVHDYALLKKSVEEFGIISSVVSEDIEQ